MSIKSGRDDYRAAMLIGAGRLGEAAGEFALLHHLGRQDDGKDGQGPRRLARNFGGMMQRAVHRADGRVMALLLFTSDLALLAGATRPTEWLMQQAGNATSGDQGGDSGDGRGQRPGEIPSPQKQRSVKSHTLWIEQSTLFPPPNPQGMAPFGGGCAITSGFRTTPNYSRPPSLLPTASQKLCFGREGQDGGPPPHLPRGRCPVTGILHLGGSSRGRGRRLFARVNHLLILFFPFLSSSLFLPHLRLLLFAFSFLLSPPPPSLLHLLSPPHSSSSMMFPHLVPSCLLPSSLLPPPSSSSSLVNARIHMLPSVASV